MTLDEFWQLIATKLSAEQLEEADFSDLEMALEAMSAEKIKAFDDHFNRLHAQSYSLKLWGAAYIINGGCSDDGFEYFRSWLIGKGRDIFEAALANPDSLATEAEEDMECEELKCLAGEVYEKVTGNELSNTKYPYPDEGEGCDFEDDDEMQRRYPKLCKKFW